MSNYTEWARKEIELAGLFGPKSDYDGMLGDALMALVEAFDGQGHSGMSASIVAHAFGKLMRWEPLTPITSDPDEWYDRSGESGGPLWQNKRDSKAFSKDGGKTWTRIGDPS